MSSTEITSTERGASQGSEGGTRVAWVFIVALLTLTAWVAVAAPASAWSKPVEPSVVETKMVDPDTQAVVLRVSMHSIPYPDETFAFRVSCPEVQPVTLGFPDDITLNEYFGDYDEHFLFHAPVISDAECSLGVVAPTGWDCPQHIRPSAGRLDISVLCYNLDRQWLPTTTTLTTMPPTTPTTTPPTSPTTMPASTTHLTWPSTPPSTSPTTAPTTTPSTIAEPPICLRNPRACDIEGNERFSAS